MLKKMNIHCLPDYLFDVQIKTNECLIRFVAQLYTIFEYYQ